MADPQNNSIQAWQLSDKTYIALPTEGDTLTIQWMEGCQATIQISEIFRTP